MEGTNKLQAEIESARRIPENQRALISAHYLEQADMVSDNEGGEDQPQGNFAFQATANDRNRSKTFSQDHLPTNRSIGGHESASKDSPFKGTALVGDGELLHAHYDIGKRLLK